MRLKDIFASSDSTTSLGSSFRSIRFQDFKRKVERLPTPIRILDVGGLESFWINNGFGSDDRYQITILNLSKPEVRYSNFQGIAGDATDLSSISDNEYDVVFSNSVIEHVYTYENQLRMSSEIRRVGRYYYVQTPNKHFFLEPHYLLPFFQYLPKKVRYLILTRTPLSRGKKWNAEDAGQYVKEIRLIALGEMKKLFPDASFYYERFLGMVKSFTAHNFNS